MSSKPRFLLVFGLSCWCLAAHLTAAEPGPRPAPKRAANAALQPVPDVAGLPRVLLIGDSISIGYTLPVRELLKGQANVHRPLTNCGPTTRGLEAVAAWLGEGPWDVIHFNWGLHDLKYVDSRGSKLVDVQTPGARQQVPLADYEKNLRQLVQRLQKTGATLIWCSTTPVPPGAQGRVPADAVAYNAVAAKIMREHGVAIDDLYAFSQPRLPEIQLPANVHFSPAGSQQLAQQVSQAIRQALAQRGQTAPKAKRDQ